MKQAVTFDPAESFNRHFDAAVADQVHKSRIPLNDWFNAGKYSPVQDVERWREMGPALVAKYIEWYEAHEDISVWTAPDGRPAIELDLTVSFGGVEVRCIIDQVLQAGTALIVVDLKSGSKTPENMQQLGIAACALELTYGVRPKYGTLFMHKMNKPFLPPVVLDGYEYSVEFFTSQFAMLDRGIRAGVFVAKPGKQCDRCGVAGSCPAMGVRPK